MASVDGSHSSQGASDEVFTHECGPCKSDDMIKEAKHYCQTCFDYLCVDCRGYHRKFKEMRGHEIIDVSDMPKKGSVRQPADSGVKCSCNQNFVDIYCEDHNDVICRACKTVKHRKCNTLAIQDKCTQSTSYLDGEVLKRAKSLKTKVETLHGNRLAISDRNRKMREDCRVQIQTFRSRLNKLLDTMEYTLQKDLDTVSNKQDQTSDHQISTLSTTLQMLQADCKLLEEADRISGKESIFARSIKVSQNLKAYETVLLDIEKETKNFLLSFVHNTKLENLLKEMSLGTLKIKAEKESAFLDMKVNSSYKIHTRLSDDKSVPIITGCAFLANGKLLLADRRNYNVKLLDSFLAVEGSLPLSDWPWDLTALDNTTGIVTLTAAHKLQYIHTTPSLRAGRTIPVNGSCRSVKAIADDLFVSCYENVPPSKPW